MKKRFRFVPGLLERALLLVGLAPARRVLELEDVRDELNRQAGEVEVRADSLACQVRTLEATLARVVSDRAALAGFNVKMVRELAKRDELRDLVVAELRRPGIIGAAAGAQVYSKRRARESSRNGATWRSSAWRVLEPTGALNG